MNLLRDLEDLGLSVGWRTALIGWDGPAAYERQVDGRQIVEFAVRKLDQVPSLGGAALQLASLTGNEIEEVDSLLRHLARQEDSSDELELRKWRLLLLKRLLNELPEDPLYVWVKLSKFWLVFGFPPDCPFVVRSFEEIPADERYTTQLRSKLLADHERWLADEHSEILEIERA